MVRSQATSIAKIGEANSEIMIPMAIGDKSVTVRWLELSSETAMAPPVIEAVRACEDDTATPRHQVKIAHANAVATPTAVMANPVLPDGTSATNSAAKNWIVLTPMTAPIMRMTAVMATAFVGVSAPEAMGRATALGVSRPATTKLKAAVRAKTAMSKSSVLTRNHAPGFVLTAYKIRGSS